MITGLPTVNNTRNGTLNTIVKQAATRKRRRIAPTALRRNRTNLRINSTKIKLNPIRGRQISILRHRLLHSRQHRTNLNRPTIHSSRHLNGSMFTSDIRNLIRATSTRSISNKGRRYTNRYRSSTVKSSHPLTSTSPAEVSPSHHIRLSLTRRPIIVGSTPYAPPT